jgi:hypothetical protein
MFYDFCYRSIHYSDGKSLTWKSLPNAIRANLGRLKPGRMILSVLLKECGTAQFWEALSTLSCTCHSRSLSLASGHSSGLVRPENERMIDGGKVSGCGRHAAHWKSDTAGACHFLRRAPALFAERLLSPIAVIQASGILVQIGSNRPDADVRSEAKKPRILQGFSLIAMTLDLASASE